MQTMAIDQIKNEIVSFLKRELTKAKKYKYIIGLSGGIDSSVVYALAVEAIGSDNVLGYSLPYYYNGFNTCVQDANMITKYYNSAIREMIDIKPIVSTFYRAYDENSIPYAYSLGNIMARVRMTYLYDMAMKHDGLVLNTCNLSEDLVGYTTKFGDAAGDIAPIAHLTKTEIFNLAKCMNLPEHLINRVPSAELWEGQTDEDELGFSYRELDSVIDLYYQDKVFYNYKLTTNMYVWMDKYSGTKPVSQDVWDSIRNKNLLSQHKLNPMSNLLGV